MIGTAKNKSFFPPALSALWTILFLVVALFLPETRVWGFAATPQPASGVYASVTPTSIGENYDCTAYDASDSLLAAKATPSSYRPPNALPRGKNGEMVPSSPNPHTQLGTETSRKAGDYTAAREWGANGQPVRDIHFTDHGRPSVPGHVNPHQHQHIPNPTGGTPQYGPAKPYNW